MSILGWSRPRAWALALLVVAAVGLASACDGDDGDGDMGEETERVAPRPDGEGIPPAPAFDAEQLTEAPTDGWITNGGTVANMRFSPLDAIDAGNVGDLKGVWHTDLGGSGVEAKYSGEAQPLVYGGVAYVITGADDVFAVSVESGEILWTYEADLDQGIETVCCGWTSRGVAIGDGRVYVGRLDGALVALDQTTGEPEWTTEVARWQDGYTLTHAPLYYDGKVYVGVSGGEFGIRGHVTAYDAASGDQVWRFHTIPAPGEPGHDTWPQDNEAWRTGGAPVWQTPAVDPELGLLYFSTGNTSPDFNGSDRAGQNLFANSIVAVDPDTGERRWHYQQIHHDIWDYDSPSPIVLFDIEIEGETRQALAQPSKTGWVYILDRRTGEPLIGIPERPVPQDERQRTWPTQPHPVGDAFVSQRVTQEQVSRLSQPQGEGEGPRWRYVNGGEIFTPFWGDVGVLASPNTLGGSNWPPSSFNPETGYLYVCGVDGISIFRSSEVEYDPEAIARGEEFLASAFNSPEGARLTGTFTAMDMTTNEIAWQKEWDQPCYSGSVTTGGGLVFTGHNDGRLIAYEAEGGEQLWEFQTGAGANAPATVFEWQGTQYVMQYSAGNSLIGSEHGDELWLFSLDGTLEGPPEEATGGGGGAAAGGGEVYARQCSSCHGEMGEGGHSGAPALAGNGQAADPAYVESVVRAGPGIMPAFGDSLSDEQIQQVSDYVAEELAPEGG